MEQKWRGWRKDYFLGNEGDLTFVRPDGVTGYLVEEKCVCVSGDGVPVDWPGAGRGQTGAQ